MKRFSLISAFSLVVLFAVTPVLAYPDIEVLPTSHDFGSVLLGNSATTVITISNVGGHPLLVYSLDFQAGSSAYLAITVAPPLPVSIPAPDGMPNWIEIEVTYSPSDEDAHNAVLEIETNDPDEGVVQVALTGTGFWKGGSPLEVSPLAYYFGDVELGTCSETFITVTNITEVYIVRMNGTYFSDPHDPSFTFGVWPIPLFLYPGMWMDVPVKFCPQATGSYSTSLWIDTYAGIFEVALSGTGVQEEPPPEEQVQEILDFIDESVEAGTLEGSGAGNSADRRLNALINMIEAAGDLIEQGRYEEACDQLWAAYRRCDGDPRPPDFVEGEAREQLAAMILALIESLGCE
jgi:hypothetical protein